MAHVSVYTPLGAPVTLFEEDGALVAVDWGRTDPFGTSDVLDEASHQLEAYFDGKLKAFNLPLRPSGTDFQRRVWHALSGIPFGVLKTYGDIARSLGSSARAVGGACARNPIPIIIPCHRVVGASGAPGGYSGLDGLVTKSLLLRLEGLELDI